MIANLDNECIDLEAQEVAQQQVGHADQLRTSLQKLEELVHGLTQSVILLQSAIIPSHELSSNERAQEVTKPAPSNARFRLTNRYNHDRQKQPEGQLHERSNHNRKIEVATPQDLARYQEFKLKQYQRLCSEMPDVLGLDPWKLLERLDWSSSPGRQSKFNSDQRTMIKPNTPHLVNYLSKNPTIRYEIVQELYASLSRWFRFETSFDAFLDGLDPSEHVSMFGPWVALIGLRLAKGSHRRGEASPGSGIRIVRILMVLLDMPFLVEWWQNKATNGVGKLDWRSVFTVRSALHQCYRNAVLIEPAADNNFGLDKHIDDLNEALKLVNLWERPARYWESQANANEAEALSLHQFWKCSFGRQDAEDEAPKPTQQLPESHSSTFAVSELNLHVLRTASPLKIVWTEYLSEHLDLDLEASALKIFWFGHSILARPIHYLRKDVQDGLGYTDLASERKMNDELLNTYSLLFRSRKDTHKENLAEYGRLPIPLWLSVFTETGQNLSPSQAQKDMSFLLRSPNPMASDVKYHLSHIDRKIPATQQFDRYPIWGSRLRQLKAYLDNSKPSGLRGLWEDRRDCLQYYTFWAVIIIGGTSIILSILGLIVSIIQTAGTYEALRIGGGVH